MIPVLLVQKGERGNRDTRPIEGKLVVVDGRIERVGCVFRYTSAFTVNQLVEYECKRAS